MVEFSLPRGLRDILPEESSGAEAVRSAFVETCRLFDYKLMEPSSLELLETLEAKSGAAIRDETYYFKDKSGRDLGLRFDLTVGITRYVASRRDLDSPIRLGSYGSVWRYDEPQYARYRWFYQWDIELFGPSSVEADAEIIEFTARLFQRLGTKPRLSIGSRKIMESFIRKCKITEEQKVLDAFRAVDKLSKRGLDQISKEYERSLSKEQLEEIANFSKIEGDPEKVASEVSNYKIDSSSLLELVDSLKGRGVRDTVLNLRIVRGLDYYTDMVFEAYDAENLRLGSLCGGGRYDSLPSVYGRPDLGATGVAGGVERAILAYKISSKRESRVFVAPIGKNPLVIRAASNVAAELRSKGIPAQSEITEKSLRKILEAQVSGGTKAIVFLGEKELAENTVKLKWLDSGEETALRVSDLAGILSAKI